MNRKQFILKGAAATLAASIIPVKTEGKTQRSTYDHLMDQVGFNHIPNKEIKTMNTVYHKADSRGHANHGWLNSYHTFSFANYYNPERVHFGVLRVLNDDTVAPGKGFGTHPHDNMEIISIPLSGDLEHKDSMGNVSVIKEGDIQVMSAGTGIQHSEFNHSKEEEVKFLQIWVFPHSKGVEPRYDQISLKDVKNENEFYQVLSPNANDDGVWIHQNAWFHLGDFTKNTSTEYKLKDANNGVYIFVLEGSAQVQNQKLEKRDGFGVWNTDSFTLEAHEGARILLMEVPMTI